MWLAGQGDAGLAQLGLGEVDELAELVKLGVLGVGGTAVVAAVVAAAVSAVVAACGVEGWSCMSVVAWGAVDRVSEGMDMMWLEQHHDCSRRHLIQVNLPIPPATASDK